LKACLHGRWSIPGADSAVDQDVCQGTLTDGTRDTATGNFQLATLGRIRQGCRPAGCAPKKRARQRHRSDEVGPQEGGDDESFVLSVVALEPIRRKSQVTRASAPGENLRSPFDSAFRPRIGIRCEPTRAPKTCPNNTVNAHDPVRGLSRAQATLSSTPAAPLRSRTTRTRAPIGSKL